MPEVRPGEVHYTTATKAVAHGAPCTENGFVGIALKQQPAPAGTGLGAPGPTNPLNQVQVGESFAIQIKGRVYVPRSGAVAAVAKGASIWINATSNALSLTNTDLKFGRVTEVAPERGVGAGMMRVDLDAKDGGTGAF